MPAGTGEGDELDGARIEQLLAEAVANGWVPNVVATVADRSGVQFVGAVGDRVAGHPEHGAVGPDSVYRIASMTKPVVTVAALQLAEAGKLDLDAPVAGYLPEFGALAVLTGFDGETPQFRPPATAATVRQLITHTAGLAYDFFNASQRHWQEVTGTESILSGTRGVLASPLHTDPGTRWEYSIATDWLGLVVEAISGQDLDAYVRTHICEPLGMGATGFAPEGRATAVPVHRRLRRAESEGEERALETPEPIEPVDERSEEHVPDAPGHWSATTIDLPAEPEFWAGGTSLYSTPADYQRFARMLLGDGELDGVRILTAATVAEAFTDQIAPLELPTTIVSLDPRLSGDFVLPPGWGWGHGLALNKIDLPGMRRAYSGSWGGIFNTGFWVDRTSGVTGAIYSQCLPGSRPEFRTLAVGFELAVYS
ncbi:MAG: serine hydrolase domain-containing protein [Sporichthyaceae bacterium]